VIFHSYVSLPEGTGRLNRENRGCLWSTFCFGISCLTERSFFSYRLVGGAVDMYIQYPQVDWLYMHCCI
jgi:hypothetical protein